MTCACIKGNYNFSLDIQGPNSILYTDRSIWMEEDFFDFPEKYDISISHPLGNKTLSLNTTGANSITPKILGSGGKLPDGIYTFSTTSCGKSYSRTAGLATNLRCCLEDLIAKYKYGEDLTKIYQLEFYIRSFEINGGLGKIEKAREFFEIAERQINLLNCNCKCYGV